MHLRDILGGSWYYRDERRSVSAASHDALHGSEDGGERGGYGYGEFGREGVEGGGEVEEFGDADEHESGGEDC